MDGLSPSWASGSLDNFATEGIKAFEDCFTVNLIATPRAAFRTCTTNEKLAGVVERNRRDNFDFLPVTESDTSNHIIGLIELIPFLDLAIDPNILIRDQMRPLSEENLIGADAGILAFVRNADRQPCRLVISGREISGLVSLSDLQRLPVRAALFTMVTHLETLMANFIRQECAQTAEWLQRLSEQRRQMVRDEIDRSLRSDTFVDELLFTQFVDKVMIIKKSAVMSSRRGQFKNDLSRVRNLRDALPHANDYAANRDAAREVCEIVRIMDSWIEQFRRWLSPRDLAPQPAGPSRNSAEQANQKSC
jgi:hypothetical protein